MTRKKSFMTIQRDIERSFIFFWVKDINLTLNSVDYLLFTQFYYYYFSLQNNKYNFVNICLKFSTIDTIIHMNNMMILY